MKDPNLSELVRTCIRCWLYLVPQAFLGIHLFDMFMRRKNSIKPLMIWQLLRVFLIGGISDIILRGYYGDESWWGILMMFCSVVIMIANTVLIYYTFEGSLPKVVLGAMLADIVTSMIHYPAICIVDLLSGRPLYILKCPVEPWDLLIPVLEYLFYRLEKKTILHVLRRYRDFEARYLKIIWVFVYFLPVLYYVPNGLTDIQVMFLDDILIILAIGIIIHLTDQCFIDILDFFIIGGIAVDPSQPEVCNIVDLRLQVLPLLLGIGIGWHKFHADHLIKTGIGVVLVTGCPEKPAIICHHTAICLV